MKKDLKLPKDAVTEKTQTTKFDQLIHYFSLPEKEQKAFLELQPINVRNAIALKDAFVIPLGFWH